jgi:hypothetical protein
MIDSYVAIITRRGLEHFCPENKHVLRFMLRRAYRRQPLPAFCYWAVLHDEDARQVRRCLRCRAFADALRALESSATWLGPIFPSHVTDQDHSTL